MKKVVFGVVALALCLIQYGCVPLSSHPAYTHKDVIYDANLLGKWEGGAGGAPIFAEFKTSEQPNVYTVFLKWKGKQGTARAVLFKLNDQKFMDISLGEAKDVFVDLLAIPGHMIVRIDKITPELTFVAMDKAKTEALLDADPNAVENSAFDNDKLVLTCSTRKLQKFLIQHAKDESIFTSVGTLKRGGSTSVKSVPDTNQAAEEKK